MNTDEPSRPSAFLTGLQQTENGWEATIRCGDNLYEIPLEHSGTCWAPRGNHPFCFTVEAKEAARVLEEVLAGNPIGFPLEMSLGEEDRRPSLRDPRFLAFVDTPRAGAGTVTAVTLGANGIWTVDLMLDGNPDSMDCRLLADGTVQLLAMPSVSIQHLLPHIIEILWSAQGGERLNLPTDLQSRGR